MIENFLIRKQTTYKTKITVKSLIAIGVVVLSIGLPQIVHLIAGAEGGAKWLPMYLPVLLGGLMLGSFWGLGIAVISPLLSFAITSLVGNPMPILPKLPFMMAELAVFAVVSGAFSNLINKNALFAFPAVLLAGLLGRSVFMLLVVIFQAVSPLNPTMAWAQIKTGLWGLGLQVLLVPILVIGLQIILNHTDKKAV